MHVKGMGAETVLLILKKKIDAPILLYWFET